MTSHSKERLVGSGFDVRKGFDALYGYMQHIITLTADMPLNANPQRQSGVLVLQFTDDDSTPEFALDFGDLTVGEKANFSRNAIEKSLRLKHNHVVHGHMLSQQSENIALRQYQGAACCADLYLIVSFSGLDAPIDEAAVIVLAFSVKWITEAEAYKLGQISHNEQNVRDLIALWRETV